MSQQRRCTIGPGPWPAILVLSLGFACAPGAGPATTSPTPEERPGWSPSAERLFAELTAPHSAPFTLPAADGTGPLAVFDCDNTMILGDIAYAVLVLQVEQSRYGFDPARRGAGPWPPEVADLFAQLGQASSPAEQAALRRRIAYRVFGHYEELIRERSKEDALAYLSRLLQGLTPDEAHGLARDAMAAEARVRPCLHDFRPAGEPGDPFVKPVGLRLRPQIASLIARLRQAGYDVWVVSASPQPLVEVAAAAYGVPADRVIGTRVALRDGKLTGEVIPPVPYREGKSAAIRKYIGRRPVLVLGDSWTDFEMLTWAEHGVLLERSDAALVAAARKAGLLIEPRFAGEPEMKPCEATE